MPSTKFLAKEFEAPNVNDLLAPSIIEHFGWGQHGVLSYVLILVCDELPTRLMRSFINNPTSRPLTCLHFLIACQLSAAPAQETPTKYAILNINNMTAWMSANGKSSWSPTGAYGLHFPRGIVAIVHTDGTIWGAKAYVDAELSEPASNDPTRVGVSNYRNHFNPGRIIGHGANAIAADSAESRIYRIRRDYQFLSTSELRRDAAETYEIKIDEVTNAHTNAIRARYHNDWVEWPVAFGAPFIDRNGNGIYEPPPRFDEDFKPSMLFTGSYDEPGIAAWDKDMPADQVIWTVYNDHDINQQVQWPYSSPMGLEVQITQWAFKDSTTWGGYFYRRARLINKGGVEIDENGNRGSFWLDQMYLGHWADIDLGQSGNDLTGCDTLLDLGYVYNADPVDRPNQYNLTYGEFNLPPAAAGYAFLQGPRVPEPTTSAYFDGRIIQGWENLSMTSFFHEGPGDPIPEPSSAIKWYQSMQGFFPGSKPERYLPFPPDETPGPFSLAGDPVTGEGFIDGQWTDYSFAARDISFQINSGPFTLAPGDTQEVVVAFVAGLGADRLSSITSMKFLARHIRSWFPRRPTFREWVQDAPAETPSPNQFTLSQSYPNPFSAATQIRYSVAQPGNIRISVFDLLGREVALLEDGSKAPGHYDAIWDGRNLSGKRVASGVYFIRLFSEQMIATERDLMIRKIFFLR